MQERFFSHYLMVAHWLSQLWIFWTFILGIILGLEQMKKMSLICTSQLCWVFFIMTDWLIFLLMFFSASLNFGGNFRLQNSVFRLRTDFGHNTSDIILRTSTDFGIQTLDRLWMDFRQIFYFRFQTFNGRPRILGAILWLRFQTLDNWQTLVSDSDFGHTLNFQTLVFGFQVLNRHTQ